MKKRKNYPKEPDFAPNCPATVVDEQNTKAPENQKAFAICARCQPFNCRVEKKWSGRRDLHASFSDWKSAALELSYTRVDGLKRPSTGIDRT
jgi:hypothetical protein